ncbi:MAG: hypothetical protein HQK83_09845 [Fibrobacteria bacterium]|nr:hypothetical protein [Fibrobacteria bacterium]
MIIRFYLLICVIGLIKQVYPIQSPELPGNEITESEAAIERSEKLTKADKPNKAINTEKYWRAPSIDEQLARDKTLIGMGYGAIFIPSFTEPRLEPEVLVFTSKDHQVASGSPGERILLEAGRYSVRVGSGTITNKMKYFVTIEEGHTTLLKPEWGGLIVETINDDEEHIREEYEVYRIGKSSTPYGKGYGLEEERLDDIKTWLLPAGLYRITRAGEDFSSITNYVTVQLNPGELTIVQLVFKSDFTDIEGVQTLVAGGIKDLRTSVKAGRNWKYGLRFGGNVNLFSEIVSLEPGTSREEKREISALLDFRLRAQYDNTKFLGVNVLKTKNRFSKLKNKPFEPDLDDVQFRSTWTRRLNHYIGPYIRGIMETHFFYKKYEATDTTYIQNINKENIATIYNGDKIEVRPPFFPLEFNESVGFNFQLFSFYSFELSMLSGLAAKQYIHKDVWQELSVKQDGKTYAAFRPLSKDPEIGLAYTINVITRLGSMLTLDYRADLFNQNFKLFDGKKYTIDEFLVELRLNLTRYFEISYQYELDDRGNELQYRFWHIHNLLFRISLNI